MYFLPKTCRRYNRPRIYQCWLGDRIIAYIVGAPEALIARNQGITEDTNQTLMQLLNEGLRVVAIGVKEFSLQDIATKQLEMKDYKQLIENNLTIN